MSKVINGKKGRMLLENVLVEYTVIGLEGVSEKQKHVHLSYYTMLEFQNLANSSNSQEIAKFVKYKVLKLSEEEKVDAEEVVNLFFNLLELAEVEQKKKTPRINQGTSI